jgi:hypothetical protein
LPRSGEAIELERGFDTLILHSPLLAKVNKAHDSKRVCYGQDFTPFWNEIEPPFTSVKIGLYGLHPNISALAARCRAPGAFPVLSGTGSELAHGPNALEREGGTALQT